jgi:CheY-like chemotaxis protein
MYLFRKNILLVEDDELDVISVQRSLREIDMNIQLHTAYNGEEALSWLRGENGNDGLIPDIIILDLNMPKMNGLEFLQEIRKDSKFSSIKVFVMTTSNDENDRAISEKLGISGYIIKPLNFNENTKKSSSMDYFMHFQLLKIIGQ